MNVSSFQVAMLLLQHCDTLINASSMGVLKFKTAKEYKGLLRLGGEGGVKYVLHTLYLWFSKHHPFFWVVAGVGGRE